MSNIAISVENLSKQYRLGQVGTGAVGDDLSRWWAKIRGKDDPFLKVGDTNDRTIKGNSDFVWSLKDVNFEINQGDAVGIIGRNGAGKSTLLKLLSKVTQPTTGIIRTKGRIASLLEVGTGFHPELSGRENIFLNGAILGMTKSEIKRKFDEIVDFSGVERYIDTPVKRYSSGMYVRLAFAVAAHLESEILIVDEVLAVGDAEFQKKCLGKMGDISSGEGRTVLFVSHNMGAVRGLCNKGIFLENGLLEKVGNLDEIVDLYLNSNSSFDGSFKIGRQHKDEKIVFERAIFRNQNNIETQYYNFGDSLEVEIKCTVDELIESPYFWISVESQHGTLFAANSLIDGFRPTEIKGEYTLKCIFKSLPLYPQTYVLYAGARDKKGVNPITRSKEIGSITIISKLNELGFKGELADSVASNTSPLFMPYTWNFGNEQIYIVDPFKNK